MKKFISRLFLLSAIGIMSLASYAQSDAELKQIIERNNKMAGDAMKAGDTEKVLSLYAEDAVQLPNNAKMLNGISEIRKDQEEMLKEGWKVKEYNTNVQTVESHGDIVTEIGTYLIGVQKEGTSELIRREGKYVCLWEKQADGSLKLKTEIWNHDQSYNETMAETDQDKIKDPMMKDKHKDKSKMSEVKTVDDDQNNDNQ